MSSILDALKKVEEEKAARDSQTVVDEAPFEPEAATDALFGKPAKPERQGVRVSPMALFIGGGLFALVVACVSVAAVMLLTPDRTPGPLAGNNAVPITPPSAPANPVPEPSVESASTGAPAEVPAPAPVVEPATQTPPAEPVAAPAPETPQAAPAPQPASPPVTVQTAPPVSPRPAPPPPKEAPPKAIALPKDISTLPPLRVSDEVRYGLESMSINMLKEPGPNRPDGVAFINLQRIYISEQIPGTRAKLIGITLEGIAIEIMDTGDRFFVEHGRP